jgi:hypothetical protein
MEPHGQNPCLLAEVLARRQTGVAARRRGFLRRRIKQPSFKNPVLSMVKGYHETRPSGFALIPGYRPRFGISWQQTGSTELWKYFL